LRINGIGSIQSVVGTMPKEISISYQILKGGELLRQAWNSKHLAFVPFCFKCKVAVDWITEEHDNRVVFVCPQCGTEWVRDKSYMEDYERDKVCTKPSTK